MVRYSLCIVAITCTQDIMIGWVNPREPFRFLGMIWYLMVWAMAPPEKEI